MVKSIPISFRATPEEADFLARLQVDGAVTSSDKLRWLIQMARLREEVGPPDAVRLRDQLEERLRPALDRWRTAEAEGGGHSTLMRVFVDWLVEASVFLAVAGRAPAGGRFLTDLEAGAADRMARLADEFLRMGVTAAAPCYAPGVVRERVGPLVELARIVDHQSPGHRPGDRPGHSKEP